MSIIKTSYESNPIPIPPSFLQTPPAKPITLTPVPFTTIPEYAHRIAFTLDDVLSPQECEQLISLAELSSPTQPPWKPALVSVGPGLEAAAPGYRNSERIIWDRQEVVDLLWKRCMLAQGIEEKMVEPRGRGGRWVFRGVNERMRFLRYTPGMFFKPHCDAHYHAEISGQRVETHYTLQLYLNDSMLGGSTRFLSFDRKRWCDVVPKTGSVLIFQHDGLLHEGAQVTEGVKYTMRTDIMYTWEPS